MSDFPFAVVYEHIASKLVEVGLPTVGDFPPVILMIEVKNSAVSAVQPLPSDGFFADARGKAKLGAVIRELVPTLPEDVCLAIISEAWHKSIAVKAGDPMPKRNKNLEHDPDADSVILINIYRPGLLRTGTLPIEAGRRLVYAPMMGDEWKANHGQLTEAGPR